MIYPVISGVERLQNEHQRCEVLRRVTNAPAGIRTRVIGLKVRYDWPCYTTGALIGFCVSVFEGLFKPTEEEAEEFLFFIAPLISTEIYIWSKCQVILCSLPISLTPILAIGSLI